MGYRGKHPKKKGPRAKPFTTKPADVVVPEPSGDGPFDCDGLNARQRLFVEHLLGAAGGQQFVAAKMAGYLGDARTLSVQAHRLYYNPYIQAALRRELARRQLTPDDIKGGLVTASQSSMANFYAMDPATGKLQFSLEHAAENGALNQIRKVTERVTVSKDGTPVTERTVELYDRVVPSVALAKIQGMLTDKIEHSGTVKFEESPVDELLADPESARLVGDLARRVARKPGGDGPSAN